MPFKVADVKRSGNGSGWEIKVGDGETADFSIFVDEIRIIEGSEEIGNLEDILAEAETGR